MPWIYCPPGYGPSAPAEQASSGAIQSGSAFSRPVTTLVPASYLAQCHFVRGVQRGPFHDLPPEVAILTAVAFTVALGFGIVAPAIPAFARQFDVSVAAAASVISVFALMRVVGALPSGRLVDRFGEPGVMAAGIAVVAASSILAGFSQSFSELLVLRGSGGVGSAMFSISAQALLLGTVPSRQRGRASGLFSGGFLLGGINGPAVGGLGAAVCARGAVL